jgi:MFS family permease
MLNPSTLQLVYFVSGVLVGIYLPLAGLHLLRTFSRTPFGFRLVWQASLRVAFVLFGFLLFSVAFTALQESFREGSTNINAAWLGWGAIFGFFAGAILFFAGVWKAWKARAAQR